jgi:hypothetical protein
MYLLFQIVDELFLIFDFKNFSFVLELSKTLKSLIDCELMYLVF